MRFKPLQNEGSLSPNVVPMIDVLLVLIIFLVITFGFFKITIFDVTLPSGQGETQSKKENKAIRIEVDANHFKINAQEVSAANLAMALKQAAQGQKDPVIEIYADGQAPHQKIIDIMTAAKEAHIINIILMANDEKE
jgi:biopolymer transport protein ExbD